MGDDDIIHVVVGLGSVIDNFFFFVTKDLDIFKSPIFISSFSNRKFFFFDFMVSYMYSLCCNNDPVRLGIEYFIFQRKNVRYMMSKGNSYHSKKAAYKNILFNTQKLEYKTSEALECRL